MHRHAHTHTHRTVCVANLEGDHNDSKCIEAALCLVLLGFGHLHQNRSPVLIVYPRLITLCLSLLTAGEVLGHIYTSAHTHTDSIMHIYRYVYQHKYKSFRHSYAQVENKERFVLIRRLREPVEMSLCAQFRSRRI